MITSERVLITELVYSALLRAGKASRPLYYLATLPSMFESIVAGVSAAPLRPESAAAVDNRLGHDHEFPWPLDHALRRMLATNPVLRMEPTGSM
jgi:glucose-6-phosphate 1-dehydrogenase